MQTWPAGSHLLLRTVLNKGRNSEKVIFALGYKYCKAKVLFFIFTEGAGHTECRKEYAYEAKWKDENLNTLTRMIDRPHVCHLYFSNCNAIDVLNQSRQSDLKLEKYWITTNGYFRIITSLFGITVVDAWKGYVWHCGPNHRHKKINLLNFVDMLCKDMLNNRFSSGVQHTRNTTYSIRPPPWNKRHAFEIEERPSPVAHRASDSELLSYDPSNEDDTKYWITTNGYFRIITSLFGITVVDAWKGYVWHCGPNHRHKKINLLNFVDMLCKDMLNNRFSSGVQHTRNTTYSIRPPPWNKRHAFEIEERPSPVAHRASDSELLSYDPSNEDDTPFEMMNDSQISDVSMGPTDFPPSPSRNHFLVRTRQMESYSYSKILPSSVEDGAAVKKMVAQRTMRRKCLVCKTRKTSYCCKTCLMKISRHQWICTSGNGCFDEHCERVSAHRVL